MNVTVKSSVKKSYIRQAGLFVGSILLNISMYAVNREFDAYRKGDKSCRGQIRRSSNGSEPFTSPNPPAGL